MNLFKLMNLKNIFKRFSRKYYSQFGEDIILMELFKNQKNGFYVDVGAYHPFHYSNTYLLHEKGWSGINIDSNEESIRLFNKYRKDDQNILSGISLSEKELKYFKFNHPSCNTFDEKQAKEMENKKWLKLLDVEKIKCQPLSHLVKREVDFLNIDIEGMCLEALKSLNWQFRPKVIAVEDDEGVLEFLRDKNYSHVITLGKTYIFKNNNL